MIADLSQTTPARVTRLRTKLENQCGAVAQSKTADPSSGTRVVVQAMIPHDALEKYNEYAPLEDRVNWWERFMYYATMAPWDERTRIVQLRMRLSGSLKDWCTQLSDDARSDWKQLSHVFKKAWCRSIGSKAERRFIKAVGDYRIRTTLQGQKFDTLSELEETLKCIEALQRDERRDAQQKRSPSQTVQFGRFKPQQRRAEGWAFLADGGNFDSDLRRHVHFKDDSESPQIGRISQNHLSSAVQQLWWMRRFTELLRNWLESPDPSPEVTSTSMLRLVENAAATTILRKNAGASSSVDVVTKRVTRLSSVDANHVPSAANTIAGSQVRDMAGGDPLAVASGEQRGLPGLRVLRRAAVSRREAVPGSAGLLPAGHHSPGAFAQCLRDRSVQEADPGDAHLAWRARAAAQVHAVRGHASCREPLHAEVVTKHEELFIQEGNFGLVKQVVQALKQRKLLRLTRTYATIELTEVAETAGMADSDAVAAEKMLLELISNGQMHAVIDKQKAMVRFVLEDEDGGAYQDEVQGEATRKLQEEMEKLVMVASQLRYMDVELVTSAKFQSRLQKDKDRRSRINLHNQQGDERMIIEGASGMDTME
ncbi:hypothetical protein ON010_g12819 [Phytophthora cinnamomi]|nr:hypothetical protein ON010_g12819 [Phytophthora cinnamomi]